MKPTDLSVVEEIAELLNEVQDILVDSDKVKIVPEMRDDLFWLMGIAQNMESARLSREERKSINQRLEKAATLSDQIVELIRNGDSKFFTQLWGTISYQTKNKDIAASNAILLDFALQVKWFSATARDTKTPIGKGRPMEGEKCFFVMACRDVFTKHRKDDPTTYENGPFVRFCELMYEAAAGQKEPNLARQVRWVLGQPHVRIDDL